MTREQQHTASQWRPPWSAKLTKRNQHIWKPGVVYGLCVLTMCNPQQEKHSQVSEAELECAHACQGKGFYLYEAQPA